MDELLKTYYESFSYNKSIERKYEHMKRVADFAYNIAKSLDLDEDDLNLAKTCGLLHDIGRLKQFDEFNTANDLKSFDHGDYGELILKKLGITNEIVLKAVKYHNKKDIPNDLSDDELLFINITRDADKLDLYVTQGNINKDSSYEINEHIKDAFINHTQIDKTKVELDESDTLQILMMLAFTFDINFNYSFKYVIDNNILDKKYKLLENVLDKDIIELIKINIDEFIKERID